MTRLYARAGFFLAVAGMLAGLAGCSSGENEYVPPPPPEVTVSRPVQLLVTPFLEKNGETEAVAEAEVRSRVSGFIQEIKFQPGQAVESDDILYKIEPDQYDAALDSAKAAVDAAEAAIGVAKALVETAQSEVKVSSLNLKREKSLLDQNAGSQADLDNAVAANEAAVAALKSAEANVNAEIAKKGQAEASLAKAQLDVNYTTVHAPISGRISKTGVKQGNLVENGTELASVVNHEQIFANFSVSDRELLRFMESERGDRTHADVEEIDWRQIPVYLRRESDDGFPFVGKLDYVDPKGIEANTGTLGLRAQFDNPAEQLFPGLFVSVRIPTGKPAEAMLIPEYAILRDQRGRYVLIVNEQQEVERAEVTVDRTISGWAVIARGITTDSRVVVDGLQRARPGLEVSPLEKELAVDDQTLLRGLSPSGSNDQPTDDASATGGSEQE